MFFPSSPDCVLPIIARLCSFHHRPLVFFPSSPACVLPIIERLCSSNHRPPVFCAGAWSPRYNNQHQWVQADLGATYRIESVTTQGQPSWFALWVKSYYISYSQDGTNWVDIPTLYSGNVDQFTKKTNNLPANTVTRYVRLRPQTWHHHISLRFDVTGCAAPSKISADRCVIVLMRTANHPSLPHRPSHVSSASTTNTTK